LRKRTRDTLQTVTVAVGLDDRHDSRAMGNLAHTRQIAAQDAQMDCGDCGAAHRADNRQKSSFCRVIAVRFVPLDDASLMTI
jgi:hypothetical protein